MRNPVAGFLKQATYVLSCKQNSFHRLNCSRRFSILSRLQNKIQQRFDSAQAKQQEAQKDNLLKSLKELQPGEKYTLKQYSNQLEEALKQGTSGWRSLIPGMSEMSGLSEVEKLLNITKAMTDKELDHPSKLSAKDIERVAKKAGETPHKVQAMLSQFKMVTVLRQWIQGREKANKPIPESLDEVFEVMVNDRRGVPGQGIYIVSIVICYPFFN